MLCVRGEKEQREGGKDCGGREDRGRREDRRRREGSRERWKKGKGKFSEVLPVKIAHNVLTQISVI